MATKTDAQIRDEVRQMNNPKLRMMLMLWEELLSICHSEIYGETRTIAEHEADHPNVPWHQPHNGH
jgi:hypothetical protein